jgi:type 1 glutamine amidotransferase
MTMPDLRGPWEMPVYKELIRRGIAWAARRDYDA